MPVRTIELTALSDANLKAVTDAYRDLKSRLASIKQTRRGPQRVTIGATGAAKILFAFWPDALPPWDQKIRGELGYDGSAESYLQFLAERVLLEIRAVTADAARFGISLAQVPACVCRPDSTLPKLVDEYLWVTVSQGYKPPSRTEIEHWAEWAEIKKED